MTKEEEGSSHYGWDDTSRKSGPPFLSTWMAHWTGTASGGSTVNGPKVSCQYESQKAGVFRPNDRSRGINTASTIDLTSENAVKEGRDDRVGAWSNAFVEGREHLKLALAPSGLGKLDLSSSKLADEVVVTDQFAGSRSDGSFLELATTQPRPFLPCRRKEMNDGKQKNGFSGKEGKKKMNNHSDMNLFPKGNDSTNGNGFGGFGGRFHAVPRIPLTTPHEVESMRIFTTIDTFASGSSRSPPAYSKTTQHVMITKKTGVNLTESEEALKDSTVPSKFKRKPVREFLTLSSDFTSEETKTHSVKCLNSPKSNIKEIVDAVKSSGVDSRNKSSAETEAMDLDVLLENNTSGIGSSSMNKVVSEESRLPISLFLATPFTNFVRSVEESADMHESNKGISAIPTSTDPIEDEASTSRTESLDAEHLVSSTEKPTNQKSDWDLDRDSNLDHCNRWVKRLKPSYSLAFAYGTKCSMMDEDAHHSNSHKLFDKLLRCSRSSSKPIMRKPSERKTAEVDPDGDMLESSKPQSTNSISESLDSKYSSHWIQRWCHKTNPYREKNHQASFGDLRKGFTSSVAAMALMGNAMNGYRRCSYRKKGSVMVWNTDDSDMK